MPEEVLSVEEHSKNSNQGSYNEGEVISTDLKWHPRQDVDLLLEKPLLYKP